MTDRIFPRAAFRKLLIFTLSAVLLSACQSKETLPQPEFPLSEETISAALTEQGLDWSIDQGHTPADSSSTFLLLRPESGKEYGDLSVTAWETQDEGRYLNITRIISKKDLTTGESHSWEDWKDIFVLSTRLYGGFASAEELYETCSGTELPLDEPILFEDQLTGGWCRVSVSVPIQDWTPYNNGTYNYRLTLELCETKDNLTA